MLYILGALLAVVLLPQLSFPIQFSGVLKVRGGFSPASLAAIALLRDATAAIEEERRRTESERDAFADFSARIETLDVIENRPISAGTIGVVQSRNGTSESRMESVRTAYRETVMSVPHYGEDYGETLEENLRAEFDDTVAAVVANGGQFSPQLKRTLLQGAREAERSRELFLGTLDDEHRGVVDAERELETSTAVVDRVEELRRRSFDELLTTYETLERAERRCSELVRTRQKRLLDRARRDPQAEYPAIYEYLYAGLNSPFPVLSATADRIETIRDRRREVVDSIARRV